MRLERVRLKPDTTAGLQPCQGCRVSHDVGGQRHCHPCDSDQTAKIEQTRSAKRTKVHVRVSEEREGADHQQDSQFRRTET